MPDDETVVDVVVVGDNWNRIVALERLRIQPHRSAPREGRVLACDGNARTNGSL